MVSSNKRRPRAADDDAASRGEAYLDKGLSWDKRLELARAQRARIEAATGPTRVTPRNKPWEEEAPEAARPVADRPADPDPVPEYPDIPPARQAAIAARLKAEARREAVEPADENSDEPVRKSPPVLPAGAGARRMTRQPSVLAAERPARDTTAEAVDRLLSPTGAARPAEHPRFEEIRPAAAPRKRAVWVLATACILGGLALGIALALAVFYTVNG